MESKICSKCKIEKPLSDFSINKNAKDGLNYKCRPCQNAYGAMIQAHYRERARLRGKIFRQKRSEENEMVKYISFKTFNFPRDYSNTQKLLQLIGYDITQDIHLQFNQRVLMKHGKVLEYKDKPKDVLTKYFE
jgi:hypothetical protein